MDELPANVSAEPASNASAESMAEDSTKPVSNASIKPISKALTNRAGCCLLVAAAPSNGMGLRHALSLCMPDKVVAVDGGLSALREAGIEPDAAYGDFDSLGFVPDANESGGELAVFEAHKDFTDLAWALEETFRQGFNTALVCNALSGRIDHTVANLQLLSRFAEEGRRVWLVGDEQTAVALHAPGALNRLDFLPGAEGVCSVFAASPQACGVSETGLEYTLDHAVLQSTDPLGVSNELTKAPSSISVEDGALWVFFPTACLSLAVYAGAALRDVEAQKA